MCYQKFSYQIHVFTQPRELLTKKHTQFNSTTWTNQISPFVTRLVAYCRTKIVHSIVFSFVCIAVYRKTHCFLNRNLRQTKTNGCSGIRYYPMQTKETAIRSLWVVYGKLIFFLNFHMSDRTVRKIFIRGLSSLGDWTIFGFKLFYLRQEGNTKNASLCINFSNFCSYFCNKLRCSLWGKIPRW